MRTEEFSDRTLSLAIVLGSAIWGLYWFPLRAIETTGISGPWAVVFFNACPLLLLCPVLAFNLRKLAGILGPTLFAAIMIGMAFTLYGNSLVQTTVVRAIGYKRLQLLSRTQKCRSMFSTIEDDDHFVPHIDFPTKKILANPANQLVV